MRSKLLISITVLFVLVGCISNPSAKDIQLFPAPTLELTAPIPTTRLQITYIRNEQEQNYGELYAIDITCMTQDKVCFGEPKLLFQSLKMPNNEQNKPKGLLTDYSWSPEGNNIALTSVGGILIGDLNTQDWLNITNRPGIDEYEPKWSPDGKFIYYLACPRIIEGDYGGHRNCRLYRSDPMGKKEVALLGSISHSIDSYDISPDAQKIVFAVSAPLSISDLLYQANWDGTNSHQMTTGDVSENTPSFSPDGQKITFVRSTILYYADSKEESDIIVKDLVSGEEKNLTENFDGIASSPSFSPHGAWIVFYSFDVDLHANIFLVSLEQEIIVQVTHGNEEIHPAWRWFSE